MTKSDLARKYREEHGSEIPTLKLARIMYLENPLLFKDVENCRNILRMIEGKHGRKSIHNLKTKFGMEKERPKNPYKLPKSEETIFKPFIIKGHKKIGVMSDIHIPYHSISAVTAAIDFFKKAKIDALLLNGDTLDFFQLSRFTKDPRKRKFAEELATFKDFMEILKTELNCKIYFKYGNHEERYEHFLFMKAKEIIGVEEFELDKIIKSRADVTVIKDKRIIKIGGLNVIHGHEYTQGIFNPVNVARGLFLRGKTSALQGHSHQTSEHTENDMNQKITTTWSTGCLCELHPEYAPLNKWNHGFCVVETNGKNFDVLNKRIFNGEVL